VEGVLPNAKVKKRMQKLCVGLGAPCDPPGVEQELLVYFSEKFEDPSGKSLPYIAWLTHDMKWVHGFWGGRTLPQFLEDLDKVEKSPLVPASEAVEKQLRALLAKAQKAATAEDRAGVLAVSAAAGKLHGRLDEVRDELEGLDLDVRDWIAARFDWVEDALRTKRDMEPAKKALAGIAKTFKGQPEADVAARGLKAAEAFRKLRGLSGAAKDKARAQGAKTFDGTRWSSLFDEE
jgi:hypothetical protein